MPRITVDLLRRRAEHNEGCLSTLKEITLHQQDLEQIELVGDLCRQLEIVYLCNNYIPRIEGLKHLKWLKYLNLAVNNIKVIEGLEGCEALEKLDLTLNFIGDMKDVRRLRANPFLEVLHLTGNPCTRTEGYRAYVVHTLPHLKELDGSEIIKSERIAARQDEDEIQEVVDQEAVAFRESERIKQEMIAKGIDPFPPKYNEKGERLYGHSAEERLQMLREQQEVEEQKKKATEPLPGSISAIHQELHQKPKPLTPEEEIAKFGRLLMRNEGRVPFHVQEEPGDDEVIITVKPGKFISTTLIDVKIEVNCVRVWIKGKLLQIPLQIEVSPDAATVQRATTTGELKITVPIASHLMAMSRRDRVRAWRESVTELQEKSAALTQQKKQEKEKEKEETKESQQETSVEEVGQSAPPPPSGSAPAEVPSEEKPGEQYKKGLRADQHDEKHVDPSVSFPLKGVVPSHSEENRHTKEVSEKESAKEAEGEVPTRVEDLD